MSTFSAILCTIAVLLVFPFYVYLLSRCVCSAYFWTLREHVYRMRALNHVPKRRKPYGDPNPPPP